MISLRSWTVVAIVLAAALTRLLPHPDNVAPMTALAIFAGAMLGSRRWAPVLAVGALFLSNAVLHLTYLAGWQPTVGFYAGQWVVYACTLAAVGFGSLIRRHTNIAPIAGATLAGSLTFFLVTNLAFVYGADSMYPHTLAGVLTSYERGLPFFRSSLIGDVFYVFALFGTFALAEAGFPAIRGAKPAAIAE
jgi:hypothetical protein